MAEIRSIEALQVLDSRGNPTIKVFVRTEKHLGTAIVPSGASTGSREAIELRDGKKAYGGKGVAKAVDIINGKLNKKLRGMKVNEQQKIDAELRSLDGTDNKSKLGGNTLLGVSLAVCRAAAAAEGKELHEYIAALYGNKEKPVMPVPLSNVINGGKHAGNYLKVQEFLLIPHRASSFGEATQMVTEIYHVLKKIIDEKYGVGATNVGDEGGFAPQLRTAEEALNLIAQAIDKAGYRRHVAIGMDVAASSNYSQGAYDMGVSFSYKELIQYYERLLEKYNIKSIEDPFDENDIPAWAEFMGATRKRKLQVVGDDLTVTNPVQVRIAEEKKLCNAMILKVNQIGTLSEALEAARIAMNYGWQIIVSHRSGDTEDTFIADLAVGIGATQIKLGAPCRAERTSKYNRLLEIEAGLKKKHYAGKSLKF
ncbi:MAG: phosphopyruvate hydratase [archaeon]